MPYGDRDLCQHWLRQWLVAWRHQAITWTNVDLSSVRSSDFLLRASLQEIPQPSITEIIWKIKYLKFYSNFPGANELIHVVLKMELYFLKCRYGSWYTNIYPWWIISGFTWWHHQMEAFSALLAICAGGIHWSPVNSPHKGQWRRALIFSLICIWINGWVNNREAGDLRCYRAHYDVIVMSIPCHVFVSVNQVASMKPFYFFIS